MPEYKEISVALSPSAYPGEVRSYSVSSQELKGEVIVDVWTPQGYSSADVTTRYPVVYAHDGQNLFDPASAYAGVAWELDKCASQLGEAGKIVTPIIVGINNRGAQGLRANDYFPEKVLDYIPDDCKDKTAIFETCKGGFLGDEEADFVVKELKPLVDYLYNTDHRQSHTFAIGSSMGGLASLYLMCEYPEVFGGVACLSTHWIGSLDLDENYAMADDPVCAEAILAYMEANLPSPSCHRLYLDQGTAGWDASYIKYEKTARQIALNKGYSIDDGSLETYDAIGAGHNEWFWQQRAYRPLEFLLSIKALGNAGIVDNISEDQATPRSKGLCHDLLGRKVDGMDAGNHIGRILILDGRKIVR